MNPFNIQGIILDADGCILDSHPISAKVHEEITGHKPSKTLKNLVKGKDPYDSWKFILDYYQINESVENILKKRNELLKNYWKDIKLLSGVEDFINKINNLNIPYVITCSCTLEHFNEKMVSYQNLIKNSKGIICLNKDQPKKPNSFIYLESLKYFSNINLNNILLIEDSVLGIKSGFDIGLLTLFIKSNDYDISDELFLKYNIKPNFVFESLDKQNLIY